MANNIAGALFVIFSRIANHKTPEKKPLYNNGITPATIQPFTFTTVIEHGTIREQCAIDAGMTVISTDRDMYTYSGDKDSWVEYQKYITVNSKAINKQELYDRYKY